MKKSLVLLATLALPLALAACNDDDDCSIGQIIFGTCNTTSSGSSGGSGGTTGGTAGTSGGSGGGSTAGTSGGSGGGSTAGTSGGSGGGSNFAPNAATNSATTSSVKVCTTYCNSNDAGCYNISKCESEKYSGSSAAPVVSSKSNKKNKDE